MTTATPITALLAGDELRAPAPGCSTAPSPPITWSRPTT